MKLKRICSAVLAIALAGSMMLNLTACSEKEPASTGKVVPRNLREGYTEKFDGFTSQVHWVENTVNHNRIYGRVFKPDSFDEGKQYPVLIMSHGYNGSSEGADNALIQNCIAKGMIVYTYDFCGGAKVSKSEGKTTEMSILTEMTDLESVLSDIKGLAYSDDSKIVLFGQSFGGLCTALTAPKHQDDVAAVILQAPAIAYDIKGQFASKDEIPETKENNFMTVGRDFFLAFWDLDIKAEIAKWNKDIFVMVGTEDDLMPGVIETAQVYGDKLAHYAESTEEVSIQQGVHVIKDAPHSFHKADFDKAMDEINSYLAAMNVIEK